MQCPLLAEPRYASALIPALGEAVARLSPRARANAAMWLARCPKEILGAYCVRPLLGFIRAEVERGRVDRPVFCAVFALELLYRASEAGGGVLEPEAFYSDILSELCVTSAWGGGGGSC